MASTATATAVAGTFAAAAIARHRGSAACPRVAAGGRRRSCVVRCDAGVEVQAQAAAKAASIAALEQFKISADREFLASLVLLLLLLPASNCLSAVDALTVFLGRKINPLWSDLDWCCAN